MWKEPSVLQRLWLNTMSTALSTCHPTMQTRIRPQSSSARRYLTSLLVSRVYAKNFSSGARRRSCTEHLPRDYHRPTCSSLWLRRSIITHACRRHEFVHIKPHATKVLAGPRKQSRSISRNALSNEFKAIDIGTALSRMLEDDNTASETFELYGPTNYSMAEIAELVDKEIYKRRRHINVPKPILKPAAKLLNQLIWWKTTSADEVEREFLDQVIDPKAKTFKDLGVEPAELRNFTFHYLVSRSEFCCKLLG